MAWLEAASVPAFFRLADELKAHGAPEVLIRAARCSAGEKVRHARAMKALAHRHGTPVPEVESSPFTSRSLEALVLENAREGCVRETYGAVVAGWQARTAQNARAREELGRIAGDELRHAELACAVEAWAAEQLTPAERRRVREARLEAFRELERLVEKEEPEAVLIQQAGLPSWDAALRLVLCEGSRPWSNNAKFQIEALGGTDSRPTILSSRFTSCRRFEPSLSPRFSRSEISVTSSSAMWRAS